ncbi:MAG: EAL domain-containing protein [Burkholderiales bacterium]|nr:EAL domain-containing protein [Burkholderiales bacterium]
MAAELVINSGVPSAMPGALMLLLALAVSSLASYVALDLARRVRVLRTRTGALWLLGAAAALSLGIWSCQIIGTAAEPLAFPIGYNGEDSLLAWTVALAVGLAGFGAVSGRIATHVRVGLGAFALGTGMVGAHVVSLNSLGLQPGINWQMLPLVAAISGACGGCMMALGAFFRGGDRSKPPTVPWQVTAAVVLGATLVGSQQLVTGAAGLAEQSASLNAERIASTTLALFASVGSIALLVVGLILSILEARLRRSLRRAETELQRRSFRDGLTRLPNRLMFEGLLAQSVQQADASGERMAMLFIDLDGFKPVNESLGHHMGDLMLREIATRLKRFARPDDRVAHLGGDEFLMLIRGNPSEEDAATFADRMQGLIGEPCKMNGREAAVSSSVGIAMYPEHGAMSDLIAHAEAAMGAAKSGGGASHCFFEARMVSGARDQFDLLRDLRRALVEGQLHLMYQPKVHAPSGEITGAEALMRWEHPQRGLVPPTVFIPIAERFGLIGAIGNWLIDEACRQAGQWRDEGLRMRVAINLSAHQLRHADLADRIDAALKRHRINPQLLTCEITESVAMEDASNAIRMVEKLNAMGVNISIDDFGTGYSSLAYLRKLRAGELKIDRSFVMDLATSADARAVVDAIVKLAQALGLKVVAEGVETEAQHEILRSFGCHELQGFLFARPMSALALSAWAMDDEGTRGIEFRDSLYKATVAGALH